MCPKKIEPCFVIFVIKKACHIIYSRDIHSILEVNNDNKCTGLKFLCPTNKRVINQKKLTTINYKGIQWVI